MRFQETAESILAGAAKGKALSALWTFPSILFAAFCIAWAAEAAQVLVSRGLALAVLAWLQTAPEFAVEGVIAWRAGKVPTPENIGLMTANFTGALRLLVGFGWPGVYFMCWLGHRRKGNSGLPVIRMEGEDSIPIVGMIVPLLYAFFIAIKGSLSLWDAAILIFIYSIYLWILYRVPPRQEEDLEEMERLPKWILSHTKPRRNALILLFFGAGAILIITMAHPFVESMLGVAVWVGISSYFAVQWIAPFLSESPEFLSAFYWARRSAKAPMALLNTVSSSIAELTLLIALIPIVYSLSGGHFSAVPFDGPHRMEILLTAVQALLGFLLLANFRFHWYEAAGIFALWFVQFIIPHLREEVIFAYGFWILVEFTLIMVGQQQLPAFAAFGRCLRQHGILVKKSA